MLEENRRHQELILGICSEKDDMRDELRRRMETEKQHVSSIKKVKLTASSHRSQPERTRVTALPWCTSFYCRTQAIKIGRASCRERV